MRHHINANIYSVHVKMVNYLFNLPSTCIFETAPFLQENSHDIENHADSVST